MEKCNDDLFEELLQYATMQSKLQYIEETLCAFVDAIVYQPTNECPTKDHQVQREYMTRSPPVALPKYLEEFRSDETEIVAGPDILQCKGCCGSPHNFLSAVNHQPCASCKSTVCHLCSITIKNEMYCLPCYLTESLIPEIPMASTSNIASMREELKIKWNLILSRILASKR